MRYAISIDYCVVFEWAVEKYGSDALLQPKTSKSPHAPTGAGVNATGVWGTPNLLGHETWATRPAARPQVIALG